MKLIRFILRYSKLAMVLTVVLGIIGGLCSVALVALITSRLSDAAGQISLWQFVGLVAAVLGTNLLSRSLLTGISQTAVLDLRMGLCRQVLAAPLRRLEAFGSHRVIGALTEDISTIANALLDVPNFCVNVAVTLGCVAYLGWLSIKMLPALVIFILLVAVSVKLLQSRAMKHMAAAREEWDTLVGCFGALTEGAKELKMHRPRREAFFGELLAPSAIEHRRHSITGRRVLGATASWVQVLYFVFIGFTIFALPLFEGVRADILIGYTLTVLYMRTPLSILMEVIPSFARANFSIRKVEQLGASLSDGVAEPHEDAGPRHAWKSIELAGVTHTYVHEKDDSTFTLGPLSLTLKPGELVFIAGGNGSGKTTVAKLLTGLYEPESGEVRLDGEPVTDVSRDAYRQNFSVVFAVPYLFKQLLGLTADDIDARAHFYVERLQLQHKLRVEGGQFSTTSLSQGQRKRLALLTAYVEDRPVYVFDEWAADQDPLFKETFYLRLLLDLKAAGKTVVVISHDDRYYHVADRLIKLENGQIVDEEHPARVCAELPAAESSLSQAA